MHTLFNLAFNLFRLCVWLILLTAVFVPLERLFSLRRGRILRASVATDLGYYFLSSLIPNLVLAPPLALVALVVHSLLPAGYVQAVAALPLGVKLAAALVVGEIGFYWGHRWSHEIPFLWRFHSIHHSATDIDFIVNTRAHPVDMVFGRLIGLAPLYALGLASTVGRNPGLVPLIVVLVGTVWGFFIHANLRWRFGPLEELIATPAFHHWHHTRDQHRDHNYASMLPWLDRIFGTFHLPRGAWPEGYGIDTPMPASLGEQLLHPLRRRVGPDPLTVPATRPEPASPAPER